MMISHCLLISLIHSKGNVAISKYKNGGTVVTTTVSTVELMIFLSLYPHLFDLHDQIEWTMQATERTMADEFDILNF